MRDVSFNYLPLQDYYSKRGKTDVENIPDRNNMYNVMQWTYHENDADGCDLTARGVKRLPFFVTCVRSRYKDKYVRVMNFIKDQDGTLTVHHDYPLDGEEYTPKFPDDHVPGYQHPCQGDIGGGHWMDGGKTGKKRVLIGIHVTSSTPCGRSSRMLTLNNPRFLTWIKKHACVEQEPTCKCWPVCGKL